MDVGIVNPNVVELSARSKKQTFNIHKPHWDILSNVFVTSFFRIQTLLQRFDTEQVVLGLNMQSISFQAGSHIYAGLRDLSYGRNEVFLP